MQSIEIPEEEEEFRSFEPLNEEQAANHLLLAVSICHQTQSLHGVLDGTPRRGWDYLSAKLLAQAKEDPTILEPTFWANMDSAKLEKLVSCPNAGPTLESIGVRAQMIVTLGEDLIHNRSSGLLDLYKTADGWIDGHPQALRSSFAGIRAFSDPVRKKFRFLLGLATSALGWWYRDPHNLHAPVDYHEIRGHLRLGTVLLSESLKHRVASNSITQDEDIAIRHAISEAIAEIALGLNETPMKLHYFFWNYFRNVCNRTNPHCNRISAEGMPPARYAEALAIDAGSPCFFANECNSSRSARKISEYELKTTFY